MLLFSTTQTNSINSKVHVLFLNSCFLGSRYKHYNQILLNDSGIPNIMKLISEVKTRMDGFISKKNKIDSGKTIQMARRGGAVDASSIVEEGNSSKDNEDEEEKQKNDSITIKEDFN